MSLRIRLVLLTVALVTLVVLALSWLYLDGLVNLLSAAALERSELASQQVNAFIIEHINQHSQEREAIPADMEGVKAMWRDIVQMDHDIATMLERTMALSPALVEINVADQSSEILASSNPSRVGKTMAKLEEFSAWRALPFYKRLYDLFVRRPDYQVVVPLGVAGQSQPIFTLQVVASSILLRRDLQPDLQALGAVSSAALLISIFLTVVATSRALRPLRRIEQTIDRIAQGNFRGEEQKAAAEGMQAKEFAAVENKLILLGEQYTGVRRETSHLKQSLDDVLDRMATQLDTASRYAAISRISGGVAHEIKNPLNAIALRLDLLRARVGTGAAEEELIPEIDVLSKEVRRLDRVVKTFLDFSRPVDVKMADVDLGAVAAEVAQLMTPQAKLAGIEMILDAPTAVEPQAWIRGDADMLKQAILNLVTNAMEAMKEGGRLRISVDADDETVVLSVSDTGPGIPPDVRDKVFQLYFTTKERGSGIGLAMTYRAVQLHNGTVDFVSESGRGTTFRLQFPAVVHYA